MDVLAVIRLLESFFEEQGEAFAVIGGFGLLAHGIQRVTFDLDAAVKGDIQEDLIAYLEGSGYETLHRSSGFSNHHHGDAELGRLDFVYMDKATSRELFDGCSEMEIFEGITALVPRAEHLAAMKLRALKNDRSRKLQELADVQQLARLPGVDQEEIKSYFDRLDLHGLYSELDLDE